jgi:L-lactate dehydrogenase complex protein LldE
VIEEAAGGWLALKLFIPCFLDQGAPQVAAAVATLLDRLGVAWDYPENQTCCGQFAYSLGDPATSRRLLRHFLRVFGSAALILCPSASCTLMARRHYPELAQKAGERREAEALAARTLELSEYLDRLGPLPWTPRLDASLVLHHSCKARLLGALPGAARVLSQVAGLRLLEVSPYYSCCGFGGVFSFQHPDLAGEMGEAYLEAVLATGAQGLVSLDYSCLMHLKAVAATRGWDLKFFHLAEVLLSR